MRTTLVADLLKTPNAFLLIQEAQVILNQEQKRREAFYNEITEQEKVEFINGEIVVHSPVKKKHNDASSLLNCLLGVYVRKNKLGFVGYEKIMVRLTRIDYERCAAATRRSLFLKRKSRPFFSKPNTFSHP